MITYWKLLRKFKNFCNRWIQVDHQVVLVGQSTVTAFAFCLNPFSKFMTNQTKNNVNKPLAWKFVLVSGIWKVHGEALVPTRLLYKYIDTKRFVLRC